MLTGRLIRRFESGTFSALVRHPNFRLYWIGSLVSNTGYWMKMTAEGWLVYQLTQSAFYLGVVGFATALPSLFLALFGGVLADRLERRRLMIFTQSAQMLLALALSVLTLTGVVAVWHVILIAFLSGVVNALNTPVRMGIVSDLVPRESLTNAVALSSAQFQTSRMVGPSLAGIVVALAGAGWCYGLYAVALIGVIWALVAMDLPPLAAMARRTSVWDNIAEGVRYAWRDPTIRALVLLSAVPSLFAIPYMQLMPAFAAAVLGVGAEGLGLLMSATGLGALLGALSVASLGPNMPRGKLMLAAVIAFGGTLAAFAGSRSLALAVPLLVAVGVTSMAYNSLKQTLLQVRADEAMRGRVMSLLTITTFGMGPLGQLMLGSIAAVAGPPIAVTFGGAVTVLFGLWMLLSSPLIRRLR